MFKTLPVAVVAMLALCALGASGASALESKPRLEPAPKEGKPTAFTGTSGVVELVGAGILGESVIDCAKSSMAGEFVTAKKIQKTVVTFSGCKTTGWTFGNEGTKETIKTVSLTGELGYISDANKNEPVVGLMLGKEYKKGEYEEIEKIKGLPERIEIPRPTWAPKMIQYNGGSELQWGPIRGEQIGKITPVNRSVDKAAYTLAFQSGTFGREPFWTKFEGGLAEQQLFWYEEEKKESKLAFTFNEEVKFTTQVESEIAA
jgi:hypothetical protein